MVVVEGGKCLTPRKKVGGIVREAEYVQGKYPDPFAAEAVLNNFCVGAIIRNKRGCPLTIKSRLNIQAVQNTTSSIGSSIDVLHR